MRHIELSIPCDSPLIPKDEIWNVPQYIKEPIYLEVILTQENESIYTYGCGNVNEDSTEIQTCPPPIHTYIPIELDYEENESLLSSPPLPSTIDNIIGMVSLCKIILISYAPLYEFSKSGEGTSQASQVIVDEEQEPSLLPSCDIFNDVSIEFDIMPFNFSNE
jgi:hypothetical protein